MLQVVDLPCARLQGRTRYAHAQAYPAHRVQCPGFCGPFSCVFCLVFRGSRCQLHPWETMPAAPWHDLRHALMLATPTEQHQARRPGLSGQLQQLAVSAHRTHDPRHPRGDFAFQFVGNSVHSSNPRLYSLTPAHACESLPPSTAYPETKGHARALQLFLCALF